MFVTQSTHSHLQPQLCNTLPWDNIRTTQYNSGLYETCGESYSDDNHRAMQWMTFTFNIHLDFLSTPSRKHSALTHTTSCMAASPMEPNSNPGHHTSQLTSVPPAQLLQASGHLQQHGRTGPSKVTGVKKGLKVCRPLRSARASVMQTPKVKDPHQEHWEQLPDI